MEALALRRVPNSRPGGLSEAEAKQEKTLKRRRSMHWDFTNSRKGGLSAVIFLAAVFCIGRVSAQTWHGIPNPGGSTAPASIASNDSGHLFTIVGGSTVYQSVDDGNSWVEKGTTPELLQIATVGRDGVLYAIGVEWNVVYKSNDDGESWTRIADGMVSDIDVSPTGRLFLARPDGPEVGVAYSDDGGSTWNRIETLTSPVYYSQQHALRNGVVYVQVTGDTLYKSVNNGEDWTLMPVMDFAVNSLVYTHEAHLYASNTYNKLARSTDAGETWEKIDFPAGIAGLAVYENKPVYSAYDANGESVTGFVYSSEDRGETWEPLGIGYEDTWYGSALHKTPQGLLYAKVIKPSQGGGTGVSVQWYRLDNPTSGQSRIHTGSQQITPIYRNGSTIRIATDNAPVTALLYTPSGALLQRAGASHGTLELSVDHAATLPLILKITGESSTTSHLIINR